VRASDILDRLRPELVWLRCAREARRSSTCLSEVKANTAPRVRNAARRRAKAGQTSSGRNHSVTWRLMRMVRSCPSVGSRSARRWRARRPDATAEAVRPYFARLEQLQLETA